MNEKKGGILPPAASSLASSPFYKPWQILWASRVKSYIGRYPTTMAQCQHQSLNIITSGTKNYGEKQADLGL